EAREIAKEQEALANRPWYEKALDYGGNIVNELTGVNDAKRAATGVDPITGEELTAGQRVAAGGMAAAGYIPIVGWAGRIFKGGKAVYKTTQATSAAVRAVDIYKTSQKSFDTLKTSQKGLYGLTATNGFSEAITGRDMFGNKVSKEQQEASMNAALGMLLPFGAKGFNGKMGIKGGTVKNVDNGTVWKDIKVTQPLYEGTKIPKSFELATVDGKFWVHPNGTKHMVEYITRDATTHGMPINSQTLLSSFQSSVNNAAKQGIKYEEIMKVGNWELIFSKPRGDGLLPVIKHAVYMP
ncbi:pre-toxin TG domain-containing protein, partial [Bacillus pumilus]